MDLDRHIRRSPGAVRLAVSRPAQMMALAQQIEEALGVDPSAVGEAAAVSDVGRANAAVLATVTGVQWQQLADAFEGDAIFERCKAVFAAGQVPVLTEQERKTVDDTWLKTVLGVIAGLSAAASLIGLVVTVVAAFVAIKTAGAAAVVVLLAACFTAVAVLGTTVVTFLWLFLPDRRPIDPDLYGGEGGEPFMDAIPLEAYRVEAVDIRSDDVGIVAVRVTWHTVHGASVVGRWSSDATGGTVHRVELAEGEYVVRLKGQADDRVRQLELVSNVATYGPFGVGAGDAFDTRPEIGAVMGLRGRAKGAVDAIGVLSGMQRVYHGGFGGVPFCDAVGDVDRIVRVDVRHSPQQIDAIQLTWKLKDGTSRKGPRYGGEGGHNVIIDLDDRELVNVSGTADSRVRRLAFRLSDGGEVSVGVARGAAFEFDIPAGDRLLGFFGRAEGAVDGLGPLVGRGVRVYRCQSRSGARAGKWAPTHDITWMPDGRLFVGMLREVELFGEWSADGVFEAKEGGDNPEWWGTLKFLPWSRNDYFWAPPGQLGYCVEGALWFKGSGLDWRGALAPRGE